MHFKDSCHAAGNSNTLYSGGGATASKQQVSQQQASKPASQQAASNSSSKPVSQQAASEQASQQASQQAAPPPEYKVFEFFLTGGVTTVFKMHTQAERSNRQSTLAGLLAHVLAWTNELVCAICAYRCIGAGALPLEGTQPPPLLKLEDFGGF